MLFSRHYISKTHKVYSNCTSTFLTLLHDWDLNPLMSLSSAALPLLKHLKTKFTGMLEFKCSSKATNGHCHELRENPQNKKLDEKYLRIVK